MQTSAQRFLRVRAANLISRFFSNFLILPALSHFALFAGAPPSRSGPVQSNLVQAGPVCVCEYSLWVHPSAAGQGLARSQPFSTAISAAATKAAPHVRMPPQDTSGNKLRARVCVCVEGTSPMCNRLINHPWAAI